MHIDAFERIARQVAELKKTGLQFDVVIEGEQYWSKGWQNVSFNPQHYEIKTLTQLSQLQQVLSGSVYLNGGNIDLGDFHTKDCVKTLSTSIRSDKDAAVLRKDFKSIKYFSPNVSDRTIFSPILIDDVPAEKVEEGITYRFIGTNTSCDMCVSHLDPLYVYLDKGFVFAKIKTAKEKEKIVITSEMTPDTYLVMLACHYNRNFTKLLENECFINPLKAKLLRVKVEKELLGSNKLEYDRVKAVLLTDYEKAVNSNMLIKVQRGELPHAVFNQMRITKNSATYDTVKIEADGLLEFLNDYMVFDENTDIYTVISSFIKGKLEQLDAEKFPERVAEVIDDVVQPLEDAILEKAFRINGINISVRRTTANTRRTVNGQLINMEEIEAVCYRASCLNDQDTFDKFVASVTEMSLKWHDAIGSGLPAKIHDGLTTQEYSKAEAPISCPRIRFIKEKDGIYLITGETDEDRAKIKLNAAIKGIQTLNRKVNNKYTIGDGYTPRNAAWGRNQLASILKECCTFEQKTPWLDEVGVQKIDPTTNKKQWNVTKVCTLTDEKAAFIGKMAQEYYEKAVQRSKILLDRALKTTGATSIVFNGEEAWYIEGALHKYAVIKATNVVYNFERGNSICIVEPGHRVEIGFDATVARLMALKNDQVTVAQVGTLRQG